MEKVFTHEELGKYDGIRDSHKYIAVNGIVYDVTNSKGWKNRHHGHTPGKDLSEAFKRSPHNNKFLEKLPKIGKYIAE